MNGTTFFVVLLFYMVFGGIMGFIIFCVLWIGGTWAAVFSLHKYLTKNMEPSLQGIPFPLWVHAIVAVLLFLPALYLASCFPDLETLPI